MPSCKARVWDNGDKTDCGRPLPCPLHGDYDRNDDVPNRMWRLRPEEFHVLKRAATILRKRVQRHSEAKRSVVFLDALIEAQKEANSCSPR